MAGEEMNIDNVKRISKHVGYDGESYFCWNCYHSGFKSPSHVNGHQSVCPARQIPPLSTSLNNILEGGGGGGGGTPPKEQENTTPVLSEVGIMRKELAEFKSDITTRFAKVFNEIPHQQAVNNYGILGISKDGWIIIGIVALIFYSLGKEAKCYCDNAGSVRRRLGSTIQDKVTDKAINFGINKLFKY